MTPAVRATMTPLLIVFLLIALFMWFMQLTPNGVSVTLALLCVAGLAFLGITKKAEHERARRTRNHRRTAKP
ncbi:MAG: hypothetical protein RLN60_03080 [Phycisphaerales bacterium]